MANFHNSGILSGPVDAKQRAAAMYPNVEAHAGVVVVHRASKFRGAIVRLEADGVVLRSTGSGNERVFRMTPGGFTLEGETVNLVRPPAPQSDTKAATASGSVAAGDHSARVARVSRILVEGLHDAELIEKVWGDDLRYEGIVVERLDGIDDLAGVVRNFGPGPRTRLGVLVDHLVPGSKESRIAADVTSPYVLITGTPYIDVWQAIRPKALGIESWPSVPRGRPWKEGICKAFGVDEPGLLWKKLLSSVNSYADLEPDLVGAVEQLIDFVTEEG